MPAAVLICIFLFIVFSPCLVAFGLDVAESETSGRIYVDHWYRPRRRGVQPAPLQAYLPESELSKDFEIRSFAKGIAQRRLVLRDNESGVKLTIGQLRAAAVELVKIGGKAAAYEFALVAAASAAAMTRVKDAFAIAAREALDAARSTAAWFELHDAMTTVPSGPEFREALPPLELELPVEHKVGLRWREASQAA